MVLQSHCTQFLLFVFKPFPLLISATIFSRLISLLMAMPLHLELVYFS